jgi:hypothetical protein
MHEATGGQPWQQRSLAVWRQSRGKASQRWTAQAEYPVGSRLGQ